MANDPTLDLYRERMRSLTAEGIAAFALVEQPLPDGLRAVVRLNQAGPLRRYVVASVVGLDDTVIFAARHAELGYRTPNADDDSLTEIRLYDDGRIEIASVKYGRLSRTSSMAGRLEDPARHSRRMLKRRSSAAELTVPGFGTARLVGFE
jgi:hypothetical protein